MAGRKAGERASSNAAGPRTTSQRRVISEVIDALHGAFSAEDLLAAVRHVAPRTGRATVYRAIASYTGSGLVEQVGTAGGAALYVRCRSQEHHHHLVCTACGRVEEAECQLDGMIEHLRATRGFLVTAHHLNLSGLCAKCSDERGAA